MIKPRKAFIASAAAGLFALLTIISTLSIDRVFAAPTKSTPTATAAPTKAPITAAITAAITEQTQAAHRAAVLSYFSAIAPIAPGQRLTMGIELEGVFPGASREMTFQKLGDLVETEFRKHIYTGATIQRTPYSFQTRRGEPRQAIKLTVSFAAPSKKVEEWHLRDDGSIRPPLDFYGVELVTPILRKQSDVEKFRRLVAFLSAQGLRAQPDSAALQAHVGFTENGPIDKQSITPASKVAEALVMILTFSKIEKELMRLFAVNPARQKFTMPTPEPLVQAILNGEISTADTKLFDVVEKYYEYRYWALNVHSLFQFGTVEVRFANSTVDPSTTDAFLDLSYKIVRAVRSKDPRLLALLNQHIDEEIPLIELARALDLKIIKSIYERECAQLLREPL